MPEIAQAQLRKFTDAIWNRRDRAGAGRLHPHS